MRRALTHAIAKWIHNEMETSHKYIILIVKNKFVNDSRKCGTLCANPKPAPQIKSTV